MANNFNWLTVHECAYKKEIMINFDVDMINKVLIFCLLLVMASCSNEGHYVPSFHLTTLKGQQISETDLRGKITIINVWATWCPNCLSEISELNKLAEIYKTDTCVVFLAVSDETPEKIKIFLERKAFDFVHIPMGKILTSGLQTRMVKTYPQQIVLGKDLKIAFEHSGELTNASAILDKEIRRLK